MTRLFGTDGVRGVANKQLSCELAFRLGQAVCEALKKTSIKRPLFVIGRDTRISGNMLMHSITSGVMSRGGDVIDTGVFPTPAIAFAVRHYKASAGIVISASHNPYYDNGIKFFNSQGKKLSDETEDSIQYILENKDVLPEIINGDIGTYEYIDTDKEYIDFLLKEFDDFSLKGRKIVLDCANGASYKTAPALFKSLHAEVISLCCSPDGININDKCGSTHLEALQKAVTENSADYGLAFDGDADRLLAVDEKGNQIDGDMIMYLFAKHLNENNRLKDNTLVITVMSNIGLKRALASKGIKTSVTAVGDRYIIQRMEKDGYNLGGEQSGHIICSLLNSTGDGLASALMLSEIIHQSNTNLSELLKDFVSYPQILVNVETAIEKKTAYIGNKLVEAKINELNEKYKNTGRVLLRHSGTEPLVRVMIEGENITEMENDAYILAEVIKEISK